MSIERSFLNAIKQGQAEQVRTFLRQVPSLRQLRTKEGVSALMLAVYYRNKEVLGAILSQPYPLDIFEASALGNTERVWELISTDKSSVNTVAGDGFSPLGLAAYFGQLEIVEMLVACGAEINQASNNGFAVYPIHSAVSARWSEIVVFLLKHGADPNVAQQQGIRPLHQAAHAGDQEMVTLLLSHGASKTIQTEEGHTASDMAKVEGYPALAEYIENYMAS